MLLLRLTDVVVIHVEVIIFILTYVVAGLLRSYRGRARALNR